MASSHTGKSKVAIVGFCQTSRGWCRYDDPDMEVWGLNRGYIFMPRADRWFEMHGPHIYQWDKRRPHRHMEWLASFPGPVYMHEANAALPNSIAYPLLEVSQTIGADVLRLGHEVVKDGKQTWEMDGRHPMSEEPYLTSSISLEIALAIHEGFEEIHLYGVDLNTDSEYAWQKPGVEFLLGLAAGRGIKVVIPANCPLVQGKIYGRGFMSPRGEQMSYPQLEQRMKALLAQEKQLGQQTSELLGGRRELDFLLQQMLPGLDHEKLEERRKQFDQQLAALGQQLAQCSGAIKETSYWISMTPEGQAPAEAVAQLKSGQSTSGTFAAEGPRDDWEAMLHPEVSVASPSPNGHSPAESLPGVIHEISAHLVGEGMVRG